MIQTRVHLELEACVHGANGHYVATGSTPWLRLVNGEALRSRWVLIRYSSGLFDHLVRPLIRFHLASGNVVTLPMNGAMLGSATWLGRVPDHTTSVSVSPTNQTGAFAFRINSIESVSLASLLFRGLASNPRMLLTAIGAWIIGSRDEARHCLLFALGGTPFANYTRWKQQNSRPVEPDGLDRAEWRDLPKIHFIAELSGSIDDVSATIGSFRKQLCSNWTLQAVVKPDADPELVRWFRKSIETDRHLEERASENPSSRYDKNDLISRLSFGETLPETAVGVLVRAAAECPDVMAFYGDIEERQDTKDKPHLRPDFSPISQSQSAYVDDLFIRAGALKAGEPASGSSFFEALLSKEATVKHVRRTVRRGIEQGSTIGKQVNAETAEWPDVEIIIPTRDRGKLLRTCVEALQTTEYPRFHVTIVDNGSVESEALVLLNELRKSDRHTVVGAPGPFNFSALCNLGAEKTSARVLAFFNNDVEVQASDWLKRLVRWVIRADVGAVGAKLLYPDGRVQHAGVALGLSEMAGHLYRGSRMIADKRLQSAHEVGAVTGAVLAVERQKFETVAGFDAIRFPVLYNDTDLCLRLARNGWRTVIEPQAVLIHHESASRGRPVDPFSRHGAERAAFQELWLDQIRDDPYFHPALSLYSYEPELG